MPYTVIPQKKMKPTTTDKLNQMEAEGWRLTAIRQGHFRTWFWGYEAPWFVFHRD